MILISPVEHVILHVPPVVESGTFTSPDDEDAWKFFVVSRVPVTSPVLVSTRISPASQPSKVTSPVLRSIFIFSVVIRFSMVRAPVFPVEVKFLQATLLIFVSPVVTEWVKSFATVTPVIFISPVLAVREREPTLAFSSLMSPVETFIVRVFVVEA